MESDPEQEFNELAARRGLDVRMTSIASPQQVEGTVNGNDVYFRARSGAWTLTVTNSDGAVRRFLGPGDSLDHEAILTMVNQATLSY